MLEDQEGCDDGNVTSGDGCSQSCRIEATANAPPVMQYLYNLGLSRFKIKRP
ncbi:MAG: hypothetical protein ABIJ41_05560 [Candidatus Omnitrophota bacterium]